MVRGKKQWLKPADLRTKKLTEYEKQRNKRIKENYKVMNNLGVKNITNSLVSAVQPKCANARENGIRVEVVDDVEYNPSESEDDNDNESLGSFDREEQEMASGLRLRSHSRPLTPTPEERMDPPNQEVDTQSLPPHNVQPEDKAHRIVDKDGKMLVPILEQFHAPVGDNASKLVSKIGIEVRTQLPDLNIRRWKKVNAVDKESMIQRLADQFDLQGNRSDVAKALDTQFGRRLSGFTYKLHKQYK
ncbi:hypothetical protein ACSBR2_004684 [Camellia fascicularis]